MPFEAYKIYEEYEPDKFKTTTQKKVEQALDTAKKEGLVPEAKDTSVEFEEAREIFGPDFLGPESVGTTFGVEFSQEELNQIENIPFTREELEQAKKLGMMLVLRVPRVGKDKASKPLTIKQLRGVFKGEDKLGDPKKKNKKYSTIRIGMTMKSLPPKLRHLLAGKLFIVIPILIVEYF